MDEWFANSNGEWTSSQVSPSSEISPQPYSDFALVDLELCSSLFLHATEEDGKKQRAQTSLKSKGKQNKRSTSVRRPSESKNAARERSRVRNIRTAFQHLQRHLPSVPVDTKLSKLDVLVLATSYISHLASIINDNNVDEVETMWNPMEHDTRFNLLPVSSKGGKQQLKYYHPVKKWPMRSRLYAETTEIGENA